MYGQGYPHVPPPPPPPPPPKAGLSPYAIIGIVVGGMFALGAVGTAILGGLLMVAANVTPEPATATVDGGVALPSTNAPTHPGRTTGSSTSNGTHDGPTGGAGDDDDEDEPADSPALAEGPNRPSNHGAKSGPSAGKASTGPVPTSTASSNTAPSTTPKGSWFCNASGSVRVCGFANVCNYQTVFGSGFGTDRMLASMQAKNACESMARAKGGSTVCVTQCSLR